jgi:hypothetical protein
MSIPVEIDDLAAAMEDYGWAYLLTVRSEHRPHVIAVTPEWADDQLVMPVGRRTASNATEHPSISLCFPPIEPGGYSLIVDGVAEVDADPDLVRLRPSTAVLHRPAPEGFSGSPTGCGQDCHPVTPAEQPQVEAPPS